MKSTAFIVALIGASAVAAQEPRLVKPDTREVVMTRTVTVTTFQEAGPTNGKTLADREVHRTKDSGRKGLSGGRPSASRVEKMPGFHGAAQEIPEPSNEPVNARAPMPIVVVPTLSAFAKAGKPVAASGTQGHAAPTGHRPDVKFHNGTFSPMYRHGSKAHNGTLNLLHVTNYTRHHSANHTANHAADVETDKHHDKPHDKPVDLKAWVKKVEENASNKAKDFEDSALSEAKDLGKSALSKTKGLWNEVRAEDAASAN